MRPNTFHDPVRKQKTWILIADASRARILERVGAGRRLRPVVNGGVETEIKPNRELISDRPGRAADRGGAGSHPMQSVDDWHRLEKERFAAELAGRLSKAAVAGAYDHLVLIAPPRTIGDLRASLDEAARQRVVAEIGKDLTQLSDHDLKDAIVQLWYS